MVSTHQNPSQILLFPIGTGEALQVTHDSIHHGNHAWLPDGKHVVTLRSASAMFPDPGSAVMGVSREKSFHAPVY